MRSRGRRSEMVLRAWRGRVPMSAAVRVAVLRRVYRVLWWALRVRSRLWRVRGRGVKCVLTDGERVLLVRHTYGRRDTWYLPGGGARRGESPRAAAAREIEEELGVSGLRWRELGTRAMRLERLAVDITCLHAELADPRAVRPDPVEIAQARWFQRDELPRPRGVEVGPLVALLADLPLP